MKKLMTSTIIVLPLLILAIMLVSGAIMSLITHIYVENVEFVQNDTLVLVMENESLPPSEQLLVNVFPLKADNRDVFYTVGDESIAAVDENGVVTAKFYGETYITVTSVENKAASAQRKLIITDKSVHKIVLGSGIKTEMYEGETQSLSVSIYPQEAENRLIHWQSSDERILHVGENGVIQSVGAGKATVTAISDDNEQVTDGIEIMCYKQVTGVSFDKSVVVTSLDSSVFPEVKPVPSDAFVKLAYSSGDDKIASVDQTGKITFHKAGKVKIYVHATDFGGKIIDAAKEYISTNGYFIPPLFTVKDYSVDYDDYGTETPLPVEFTIAPDGAYRKVTSIVCDPADQLAFDESAMTFRFAKEMPVGKTYVDVIVHATVYDAETHDVTEKYEDKFRVNVSRDATNVEASYNGTVAANIQTKLDRLTFTTLKSAEATLVNVLVYPENHTNTIKYELIDGENIAKIENGALSFSKEGTAKVKISLLNAKGEETAAMELSVTYTPPEPGDVEVKVQEQGSIVQTSLNIFGEGESAKDSGVIYFTKPADTDVEYAVTKGQDIVKLIKPEGEEGNYKIEPLKGGFAEVQITATQNTPSGLMLAASGERVWTIQVYVDLPVKAEDFEITFNGQPCANTFRTSLAKVGYHVELKDRNGSSEGKELTVTLANSSEKVGGHSHSGEVIFTTSDEIAFMFGVSYTDQVPEQHRKEGVGLASVSRSVSTTRGKLDEAPKIKNGEQEIGLEEHLTFGNIGDTITLKVEGPYHPSDFVLQDNLPTIVGNECVTVKVSEDGTITLTSTDLCENKDMILTVGGVTFKLIVTVQAKADRIAVVCCDQTLEEGKTYQTLLSKLTFTVTIGREDGKDPTNPNVEYRIGEEGAWTLAVLVDGKITLEIKDGESTIYFRSQDEGADIDLKFSKVKPDDFGLQVSYVDAKGNEVVIEKIESAKDAKLRTYVLPAVIQNRLLMKVLLNEDYLGKFGTDADDDFKNLFTTEFDEEKDITITHEAMSGTIILSFMAQSFEKDVEIKCGDVKIILQLERVNLASVELTGFDSGKDSDVYRGYQQVRVFAKHSDYDGKQVDYYKIPYLAVSDIEKKTPVPPEHVHWEMKKVKDGEEDEVLASQRGKVVTVGDKTYKIVPEEGNEGGTSYVLEDQDGKIVSGQEGKNPENIPWVDVFSEAGFSRIYFGNFKGLSEVDVQNDYFGNFGEKEDWQKVGQQPDDQSGRDFKASEGAYSFLRVEAGDGAKESSVNAHFNFNVLEDDTLVNVFNATGYFNANHRNVVLHNDLYGEDELSADAQKESEAKSNDLILNQSVSGQNDSNVTKDSIYGNGYQVNIKVLNDTIVGNKLNSNKENTANATTFGTLYNVTLKGRNPHTDIKPTEDKIYFLLNGAYYSDIQYYSKLNPSGNTLCLKNTVLRYISSAAVQLYNPGKKVYLENVVMTECLKGVSMENANSDQHMYIRGFCDVLNYLNTQGIKNGMGALNGGGASMVSILLTESDMIQACDDHLEWFGKDASWYAKNMQNRGRFVNFAAFMQVASNTGFETYFWHDDEKYTTEKIGESISGKITISIMGYNINVVSYENTVADDGGVVGEDGKYASRTMSELFSEKRGIRLLCQYLDSETKNTEHIQWHINKVHRDTSLIEGWEEDHIEALKQSLINAKDKGWDGEWPDGSKLEDALNPSAANTKAILPSKRKFEEKGV